MTPGLVRVARQRVSRSGLAGVAARGMGALASQGLSSASNLVVAVVVARSSSPAAFGAWSIAYFGYILAVRLNRAVASLPMMLGDHDDAARSYELRRGAVSGSFLTGAVASVVLVGVGLVSGGLVREAAWIFAPFLPFLTAQDACRYVFFHDGEPRKAVLIDLVRMVLQVIGFGAVIWSGVGGIATATTVWGAATAVSVTVGYFLLRLRPSLRSAVSFFTSTRHMSVKLVADSVLVTGTMQVLPVIVGATAGLPAAGALRGGQTLLGGIGMMVLGLRPMLTVEAVRALKRKVTPGSIVWRWSLVLGVVSGVYGLILLLLPDGVGEAILGRNWGPAAALLVPLVLQSLIRGPYTGVPVVLQARGELGRAVRLRLVTTVPMLALPLSGALLGGAVGAAWGIAAGSALAAVCCLVALRSHRESDGSDGSSSGQGHLRSGLAAVGDDGPGQRAG